MAATGARIDRIIAIGGGAASDLFRQIIADSMGIPVYKAKVAEASALGAGMCAAKGAGWYPSLQAATEAMSQSDLIETKPIAANVARYKALRAIYDDLWPQLAAWNTRLWTFANT